MLCFFDTFSKHFFIHTQYISSFFFFSFVVVVFKSYGRKLVKLGFLTHMNLTVGMPQAHKSMPRVSKQRHTSVRPATLN